MSLEKYYGFGKEFDREEEEEEEEGKKWRGMKREMEKGTRTGRGA